jgi:hypothetical protein
MRHPSALACNKTIILLAKLFRNEEEFALVLRVIIWATSCIVVDGPSYLF